ncbi:hypothetical protein ACFSBZ_11960 [Amnibacterium flavum]|uniref:Peptide ABC transporter permease n=1 Tax=Amnibacterium flavum TaxID=2173173 RepID=A0A2V1HXU1_9MICO|nr:hypothetical protein [Amnibacterium flavum]PVZ95517.1 hypothetical protein DDQ50_03175 [Amnibacterium flavum]
MHKLSDNPSKQSASATHAHRSDLISWRPAQPGLWSGQIGFDFAGLIELTDDEYVVTDWRGDRVGIFDSLADAQRALEPSHRAQIRDAADRSALRLNIIMSAAFVVTTVTAASFAGAWFTASL